MRRAARVDANQELIVEALRVFGATVQHLHTVGQGCPDLLVGRRGVTYLLEVKMPKEELTEDQGKWIAEWRGSKVHIVRTPEEAIACLK